MLRSPNICAAVGRLHSSNERWPECSRTFGVVYILFRCVLKSDPKRFACNTNRRALFLQSARLTERLLQAQPCAACEMTGDCVDKAPCRLRSKAYTTQECQGFSSLSERPSLPPAPPSALPPTSAPPWPFRRESLSSKREPQVGVSYFGWPVAPPVARTIARIPAWMAPGRRCQASITTCRPASWAVPASPPPGSSSAPACGECAGFCAASSGNAHFSAVLGCSSPVPPSGRIPPRRTPPHHLATLCVPAQFRLRRKRRALPCEAKRQYAAPLFAPPRRRPIHSQAR
jgi:hypothetical protein